MRNLVSFIIFLVAFSDVGHAAQSSCESLFQPTKQEITMNLAINVGLHYSAKPGAGYSREAATNTDEKDKKAFVYHDSKGEAVIDSLVLARIDSLVVPPGYSRVWIAEDPLAHIQVRGYDKASRPQYKYHEIWTQQVATASKFARMREFGLALPELRAAVEDDLRKDTIDKDSKIAAIIRLLEVTGIRIGSDQYARSGTSFGLTTLKVDHAKFIGSKLRFQFVAKERKNQDIVISDLEVLRVVHATAEGKDPSEKLFNVTASDVNAYIKAHIGHSFSAKDFRTWVGTTEAAKQFHRLNYQSISENRQQVILFASREAAARLNNTPATALEYYIDPVIVQAYLDNQINDAFTKIIDPNLSPEENAVLYLTR